MLRERQVYPVVCAVSKLEGTHVVDFEILLCLYMIMQKSSI